MVEITNWGACMPQNTFGWRRLPVEDFCTPPLIAYLSGNQFRNLFWMSWQDSRGTGHYTGTWTELHSCTEIKSINSLRTSRHSSPVPSCHSFILHTALPAVISVCNINMYPSVPSCVPLLQLFQLGHESPVSRYFPRFRISLVFFILIYTL